MELARLVEGTVFPAVSFGPISHALCRLIPNKNRTVASYAARALKLLLLGILKERLKQLFLRICIHVSDDALRPQAIIAHVPAVVCAAVAQVTHSLCEHALILMHLFPADIDWHRLTDRLTEYD